MNTQPEALRLADELENTPFESTRYEAAAELRRLHEANQELLEALRWIDRRCPTPFFDQPPGRIHWEAAHDAGACARAAIAKHGGAA
jgi:hypothetical protein